MKASVTGPDGVESDAMVMGDEGLPQGYSRTEKVSGTFAQLSRQMYGPRSYRIDFNLVNHIQVVHRIQSTASDAA